MVLKTEIRTTPKHTPPTLKTFEELGVSAEIRRAISEMGYEHPMPVQEEVIPYLLGVGNDVIALAQTGTGKTAAFGLPVLQKVNPDNRATQAVILSPTRELCLQIAGDLKEYSRYIDNLHVLAVYGGSSIESQIRSLRKGAQVIVATPGRLIDLMHRGVARLDSVENVVLDEADEMLNMGFTESINEILAGVPAEKLRKCVIAYEPVWAIGTGNTATSAQAQEVCASIRATLGKLYDLETAKTISILYGGSMNAGNAAELLAQPDIDGGLISGASLKPVDFSKIVAATAQGACE